MNEIRSALVGGGKVGHTHARILRSLPGSEFVAVCGRDPDRSAAFAAQYEAQAFTNLSAMLREVPLDLVTICTPHPLHAEAVVAAAEHGVHVLVEKPLAPDLQGCDRAITACRKNGVRLGVISQRRLYPPVQRMRAAIQAGKIGQPILASLVVLGWRGAEYYRMDAWRGKWDLEGGGVMVNQAVHQLDLFQWLMGPIEEVFGYWDNLNHPAIEVEDTAAAVVRFQSGALGQILVSNSQKPGFWGKLHIHGSNGASVGAQTEGGSPFIAGVTSTVEPPINDIWTIPGEEDLLSGWQEEDRRFGESHDVMNYFHQGQIADMLDSIRMEREPMVNGEEGRKPVELFTAIYRSQRDRAPVRFPLAAEPGGDYDGRLSYLPFAHRKVEQP